MNSKQSKKAIIMGKLRSIKGVLKMFWGMAKEDFNQMDHKLIRITVGAVGFIIAALFWMFFLRKIIPI